MMFAKSRREHWPVTTAGGLVKHPRAFRIWKVCCNSKMGSEPTLKPRSLVEHAPDVCMTDLPS